MVNVNEFLVRLLRIWKYSLGSFSDSKTEPYDNWIAGIRTVIFVSYMVTNAFIVAGVIRHWNQVDYVLNDTEYIKIGFKYVYKYKTVFLFELLNLLVCGVLRGYSECLRGYSEASFVLLNVLRTCEF